MVLNAVYEQDFLEVSYGFRPRRSAHQALQSLWKVLMDMGGGWVLDVDIKAFFDTLNPSHLRGFLDQRVVDGVLRRTIDKWLNAGVLEDGNVSHPELGTPQGGVISPLLANIYLHEVLDRWFATDVQPKLYGQAQLIRFADDFVIVFSDERDAWRVQKALPQRFAKFGLTVHPEKTRLVAFRKPTKPASELPTRKPSQPAKTFDLLGFTHYWAVSRKGRWVVLRKTAQKRYLRCTSVISTWCRTNRHARVRSQQGSLNDKLRGHYNYYGMRGNARGISSFRNHTLLTWKYWLNRREQHGKLTWPKFKRLLQRYPLLPARLPKKALQERSQDSWSRMREIRSSGSVGGPGQQRR
jgi:group II intron reverse transcriptase/maturase